MVYRELGKTGLKLFPLGIGTVRLPIKNDDFSDVDYEKAVSVLRHAIDSGINYIDTGFTYHYNGNGEKAVGMALEDGYRQKVNLGAKLPLWLCNSLEECKDMVEGQLKRMNTDYFDLYFIHALDSESWKKAKSLNILGYIEELKNKGKIKYIGFSFHDNFDVFKEITDSYKWDFCLIQLNYLDTEYQAGIKGLEYAYSKGMGVLIMEPLKGGQLAQEPPESIKEIWNKGEVKRSTVQWGLDFLYNRKEVTCVLSGMNTFEMIDENVAYAENAYPNCISDHDIRLYDEVKEKLTKLIKIPCTRCRYCMPCPFGVDIPANFEYYNTGHMYETIDFTKKFYNRAIFDPKRSTNCTGCRTCVDKCPQNIDIPQFLTKISDEWAIN